MGRARTVNKLPEDAKSLLYKLIEECSSSFEVARQYNEEASKHNWIKLSQPTIYRIIKHRRVELSRPSWDEYFMEMARLVAKRSTCLRKKVGAVLVKDRRVISTGYNGAPKGLPHCSETGCLREKLKVPEGERHEICLTPDTMVLTADGFKWISEIKVGEHVLTHGGVFAPVIRNFCRDYNGFVYVVKPRGLLPVSLTPEHPVLTIRTVKCERDRTTICKEVCGNKMKEKCGKPFEYYGEIWLAAKYLRCGDILVFPFNTKVCGIRELNLWNYVGKPPSTYYHILNARTEGKSYDYIMKTYGVNRSVAWHWIHGSAPSGHVVLRNGMLHSGASLSRDIPASVEVTDELLWLFGIYLAEGCVSGNQIAFGLNKRENSLVEHIMRIMREYFGLKPYVYEKKSSIILKYSSNILASAFSNILGSDSYTMRIAQELMLLPPSQQQHILRGWAQGDGHEYIYDTRIITASKVLALQMFQIALRLGKLPVIDHAPPRPPSVKSTSYRLIIRNNPR
ncbi:hypothetical protein KEJ25_06655, partial [Candidatus Bathyarchaeota archaeon]|nr:hypothetical protein [Candidatus Bathyarchaeota archaeon]